mmetsp:Transcript_36709/g.57657  ORF Transcript_36709/g.57657 Transcript_36709/m.57657 type:complete len:140 (-) Transcript_36709:105-524(-)
MISSMLLSLSLLLCLFPSPFLSFPKQPPSYVQMCLTSPQVECCTAKYNQSPPDLYYCTMEQTGHQIAANYFSTRNDPSSCAQCQDFDPLPNWITMWKEEENGSIPLEYGSCLSWDSDGQTGSAVVYSTGTWVCYNATVV